MTVAAQSKAELFKAFSVAGIQKKKKSFLMYIVKLLLYNFSEQFVEGILHKQKNISPVLVPADLLPPEAFS